MVRRAPGLTALLAAALLAGCGSDSEDRPDGPTGTGGPGPAAWDYQIGGDYPPPPGIVDVSRDRSGDPVSGGYSICYVNAFQTQPGAAAEWPDGVVAEQLEDPDWPGEYLLDLSTPELREAAAGFVDTMVDDCATKGFDAVELDNLDSFTRFDESRLPFDRADAVEFAARLSVHAHGRGLEVAQKNTPELDGDEVRRAGFDLAVTEDCGRYDECADYLAIHGRVFDVEYTDEGMSAACEVDEPGFYVVRRDRDVRPAGEPGHVFRTCAQE